MRDQNLSWAKKLRFPSAESVVEQSRHWRRARKEDSREKLGALFVFWRENEFM
jgi:hypothetical protein